MRSSSAPTKKAEAGKAEQHGRGSTEQSRPQTPGGPRGEILDLHRVAGNQAVSQSLRDLPDHVQDVVRSQGQTLHPATRAEMEARFGHDFSDVRVHADGQADESARALQARAYTVGQHLVFKTGLYSPGVSAGKRLLAHELSHIVQQGRGGPPPTLESTSPLEQAAHRSAIAAQGAGPVNVAGASGVGIARDEDDEPPEKERRDRPRKSKPDKTTQRGKEILEEFEERAHDPSQKAELEEERTTRRTGRSERSRHKSRALNVEEHHGFPKFLGGNRVQKYIKLTNELHYLYHEELYHLLETEFKKRGVLPKDAGRGSRRFYGRIFGRLDAKEQQAILDKVIAHAEGFDARYRQADPAKKHAGYPDKRQRLAAALRRGIREARAERKAGQPKKPPGGSGGAPTTKRRPSAGASQTSRKPVTTSRTSKARAKTGVLPAAKPATILKPAAKASLPSPAQLVGKTAAAPKLSTRSATPTTGGSKLPAGSPKVSVSSGSFRGGVPRGGGMGGGGSLRAGAAAGAGALLEAIAVPIIQHYLQEHYAESIEQEARELISKAIESCRPKYEALIESRRELIQREQAEGRIVKLYIVVNTNWADTDIGRVLTKASVARYQLVFEEGPRPKRPRAPRPGGWFGDIVRHIGGVTLSNETFEIELEGTTPEARSQYLSRKVIDAQLRSPPGLPPTPFEYLIIQRLVNNQPLDDLRDYTAYRFQQAIEAFEAGVPAHEAGLSYWATMEALIDGPVSDLIAAAKAKNIPLDMLRAAALFRIKQAEKAAEGGLATGEAEYWSEVIRLIDEK